ncbi:hypothetical protein E4U43_004547 [Claviceps pusilla]|uniref:Uncharacterized protein n=1 Tax=Claviceps pusilla TaxID=123648 RepID=A0A9P7SUM7_9HYPO|nr:hypothetical protein E4U43_004547 [Claviceps pusilla]
MKFSAILGSAVLFALEVCHANGSPLLELSVQDGTDTARCCVEMRAGCHSTYADKSTSTKWVADTGKAVPVYSGAGNCVVSAIETGDIHRNCSGWQFAFSGQCGRSPWATGFRVVANNRCH